jgi:hypothetical protein
MENISEQDDQKERKNETYQSHDHKINVSFFKLSIAVVKDEKMNEEILKRGADDKCHADGEKIPKSAGMHLREQKNERRDFKRGRYDSGNQIFEKILSKCANIHTGNTIIAEM